MQSVHNNNAYPMVEWRDDGIFVIEFAPSGQASLQDMKAVYQIHKELAETPCPVLVKAHSLMSLDYGAQRFSVGPEVAAITRATAILVNVWLAEFLFERFMSFHRPPFPVRVFREEEAAIAWLKQQREESDAG